MNEVENAPTSEIVHGGMTLAEVAELSALARLPSPPFSEILAARGLTAEAWEAARGAWNQAIEEDLERGGEALVIAFADAIADARERVRRDPPVLADFTSPGDVDSERGVVQASFQRAGIAPTHDAPIFGRPTYEKAAPPIAPPRDAPIFGRPAHEKTAQSISPTPTVGFVERPDAVRPDAVRSDAARSDEDPPELESTAKVPIVGIPHRTLPFQEAPPGPPLYAAVATAPRVAEPPKQRPGLGSTAPLSMPRVLPKPLPFKERDPQAPPVAQSHSAAQGPSPTQASSTAQAPSAAQGPSPTQASSAAQAPSAAQGPSPTQASSAAQAPSAAQGPSVAQAPSAAQTTSAARQSSPPGGKAPPRLTTEQYASLMAELAERPESAAQIRGRYFVAQDDLWSALQAEWHQRGVADPALRQRIAELVAHYRTFYKRAGG